MVACGKAVVLLIYFSIFPYIFFLFFRNTKFWYFDTWKKKNSLLQFARYLEVSQNFLSKSSFVSNYLWICFYPVGLTSQPYVVNLQTDHKIFVIVFYHYLCEECMHTIILRLVQENYSSLYHLTKLLNRAYWSTTAHMNVVQLTDVATASCSSLFFIKRLLDQPTYPCTLSFSLRDREHSKKWIIKHSKRSNGFSNTRLEFSIEFSIACYYRTKTCKPINGFQCFVFNKYAAQDFQIVTAVQSFFILIVKPICP